MNNDTQLAIIIINWNKAPDTLHRMCLISRWSGLKAEVIVIDNDSSHEDLSLLRNAGYRFQLIINVTNRGYAGGNNAGITKALEQGFPYIMLLNSDASISESCVKQLLECMKYLPDLGVVGPLLEEGGKNYAGGRNIGVYSRTRIPYKSEDGDPELLQVDYVPGSVLLARREAFEKVGQLEEEFFFSGEIADFCRRIQSAGLKCAVYTGCRASHTPDMDSIMRETLYNYYTLRNRFLFIRRHFRYTKFFWGLRWITAGIVQIIIALLKRKRKRAHALWLGLRDGVSGKFGDRNAQFIS
ncbi:MAG: glycosyltransferase family 2 protein [Methanotrichaceae archaeon]|nr:glycosyltransferase family 2 protein [Methanotrichaceae archaeon]